MTHVNSLIHDSVLRRTLTEEDAVIRHAHFSGAGGGEIVQRRTALIDRTLKDIHQRLAVSGPMPTLIAVGGYGRGELNPFSDIDVMYLYRDRTERERAADMLYCLWDAALDIGYSVRGIEECVELSRKDIKVRTSLMESRLVAGDAAFYERFLSIMRSEVFFRRASAFIQEKLAERASVRRRYGGSIYLREPNIKEGQGGLRDIHTAFWIASARLRISSFGQLVDRGILAPEQYAALRRSRDFLWRIRNEMHYVSGRKNDHLTFDLQERTAEDFGYRTSDHLLSVERFMKAYFIHARNISEFFSLVSEAVVRKRDWLSFAGPLLTRRIGPLIVSGRNVSVASKKLLLESPLAVFHAFVLIKDRRCMPSARLRSLIRGTRLSEDMRGSPEAARIFLSMLDNPDGLSDTLMLMKDLRFLGRYIPEFRPVEALARHDYYHKYTVDEHIILAIRNLEWLWNGRLQGPATLVDAMRRLPRRRILMLAVLLHDLGKAYRSGHEDRSREIAEKVLDRLGVSGDERQRVLFLVQHHLVMSRLSQSRETTDRKVISRFAGLVRDRENLDMLYLLTFADISAVGQSSWTQWKAALLQELYLETLSFLEKKTAADASNKLARSIEEIRKASSGMFSQDDAEEIISVLPVQYILNTKPARIIEHMAMIKRLVSERLVIAHRHDHEKGITEVTLCAYDAYGMLSRTAGVLASKNLNIVRAKAFTTRNGVMLDTFHVTDADGNLLSYEEAWSSVLDDLRRVLTGRCSAPGPGLYPRDLPAAGAPAASVDFDNDSSDSFTIIDITAADRVGLLYRITRCLYELNIDIASAKIATEGARAMDSFYVTDLLRKKITDPGRLEMIKKALLAVLR